MNCVAGSDWQAWGDRFALRTCGGATASSQRLSRSVPAVPVGHQKLKLAFRPVRSLLPCSPVRHLRGRILTAGEFATGLLLCLPARDSAIGPSIDGPWNCARCSRHDDQAAADHVYRWCRPPTRGKARISPVPIGRASVGRPRASPSPVRCGSGRCGILDDRQAKAPKEAVVA
jgi:hypothetical protein